MIAPLLVAIDARISGGGISGGIEQFIYGLLWGLGRLDDGPERYVVVTNEQGREWLGPSLCGNQTLIAEPTPHVNRGDRARRLLGGSWTPLARAYRAARRAAAQLVPDVSSDVPRSGGLYERFGTLLVHFPHQKYSRTELPTIFNPHDLQHCHLPGLFPRDEVARRDALYRIACRRSHTVVAESEFVRRDLVQQYRLAPDRVLVIPRGVPLNLAEEPNAGSLAELRQRLELPPRFALYPARMWPHKNHERLLEAMALLCARGAPSLGLVCTGAPNEHLDRIVTRARELRIERECRFLGYLPASDLRALYRLASLLVFPSLFEGGGFPVVEAFSEGLPVACSNSTALAETAGDAALLFDPTAPGEIADAMERLLRDESLRQALVARGRIRTARLDWRITARFYRALYREVAGSMLSAEDRELLANARGGRLV